MIVVGAVMMLMAFGQPGLTLFGMPRRVVGLSGQRAGTVGQCIHRGGRPRDSSSINSASARMTQSNLRICSTAKPLLQGHYCFFRYPRAGLTRFICQNLMFMQATPPLRPG